MPKISKYVTHVLPKLELIEAWYRNGADDKNVADNLNVGYSTYLKYKNEYPDLKERSQVGKEEADLKVESNLFLNATGYTYEEEVPIKCKNTHYDDRGKKVEEEHVVVVSVKKYAKPETMAQIYWLNNRNPKHWSQKQKIEMSGEALVNINDNIPRSKDD
ncbi:MAG: hypothetical protein RR585_08375 [Coprobacillus sp.]